MRRAKPLLDFGAGLLIGVSIVVALFAAMEDKDAALSHKLLLTAAGALLAAIGLKVAARITRRRINAPAGRSGSAGLDAGWKPETPLEETDGSAAASSKSYKPERRGRSSPPSQDVDGLPRDSHGPVTADGERRRL
ncbi:MAG: hypothetical protein ACREYD_06745 [Casimicrobiaceae bacterium]